jgi:hypothetical protein
MGKGAEQPRQIFKDQDYCEFTKCHIYDDKEKKLKNWLCCKFPCVAKFSADNFADSKVVVERERILKFLDEANDLKDLDDRLKQLKANQKEGQNG